VRPLFAGGRGVSTRAQAGIVLLAPLRGHFRSCTLLYAKTNVLPSLNRPPLQISVAAVEGEVEQWHGAANAQDDISIAAVGVLVA
jgi:hypothetical protein